MKKLVLLSLLLIPIFVFGQTYQPVGNATLQRAIISGHYKWRFQTGTAGYYTPPDQFTLDTQFLHRPPLPVGLFGQILKVSQNNTNKYILAEPLVYGQFIYTDSQLDSTFAQGSATQLQIFNDFNRFSHGGSPIDPSGQEQNNTIPGQPLQTNSWAYDTVTNRVNSTFNSGSSIGLISRDGFDSYIHTGTVGVTTSGDNDRIGIVLAFMEDTADMIPNNAYGLDPSDFSWPINVTDSLIPNQHDITLYFNRDNNSLSYFIAYDYRKLTQSIILNGSALSGLYNTTTNWTDVSLDFRVVRVGDTISITRSQYSDAPGGKGSLAFPLSLILSNNPLLYKFEGKHPYGYAAQSQDNAYFSNLFFSGSSNLVYDLRNGDTYQFTGSGYTLDTAKNLYTDFGGRYFWRNKTFHTYGYILPDNTYDVIVGPQP